MLNPSSAVQLLTEIVDLKIFKRLLYYPIKNFKILQTHVSLKMLAGNKQILQDLLQSNAIYLNEQATRTNT